MIGDERGGGAGGDQQTCIPSMDDDWPPDFLDEVLLQLEAVSSRPASTSGPPPPPVAAEPATSRIPPSTGAAAWEAFPSIASDWLGAGSGGGCGGAPNFSPPRELSQRYPERAESLSQDPDVIEIKEPHWGPRNGGSRGPRKDKEVERLKKELGRVSTQLNHLERECIELKKERARKDEQLKCAFSQIEVKDAEICSLKKEKQASKQDILQSSLKLQNTGTCIDQTGQCPISVDECLWSAPHALEMTTKGFNGKSKRTNGPSGELALDSKYHGPKRKDVQTDGLSAVSELKRRIVTDNSLTTASGGSFLESTTLEISAQLKHSKTIGIQTDLVQNDSLSTVKNVSGEHNISNNLLAIWGSPYYKRTGRDLVSKLFVTCAADFCVLFRCMNMMSKMNPGFQADESLSDMTLLDGAQSVQSTDAAKVSRLYVILMKMRNDMAEPQTLLKALLDLCAAENVSLVHRSLCILHAILQHLLSCDIISDRRKNVLVDQSLNKIPENKGSDGVQTSLVDIHECDNVNEIAETSGLFSPNVRSFDLENFFKDEKGCSSSSTSSSEDFVSLFEILRQIAVKYSEGYIQIEAISIMNLILMRSNPNLEREKFRLMPLLETMSHLLRKEVGLHVQKEALRLLFLLLNCPKMLMMFCSGGKDVDEHTEIDDVQKNASALPKEITSILNGLLECLACGGSGAQELKLRRQVIILLAYMASYGKPGFEVLLNRVAPQEISFLESILRVLASEMDAEAADFAEAQVLCKERYSLMREALILLNRLASHPVYSKATLGALTSTKAMANLTADVANRMSQKSSGCWKGNSSKKTKMEAEVIDLARLFRTRLCAFLGEDAS